MIYNVNFGYSLPKFSGSLSPSAARSFKKEKTPRAAFRAVLFLMTFSNTASTFQSKTCDRVPEQEKREKAMYDIVCTPKSGSRSKPKRPFKKKNKNLTSQIKTFMILNPKDKENKIKGHLQNALITGYIYSNVMYPS